MYVYIYIMVSYVYMKPLKIWPIFSLTLPYSFDVCSLIESVGDAVDKLNTLSLFQNVRLILYPEYKEVSTFILIVYIKCLFSLKQ